MEKEIKGFEGYTVDTEGNVYSLNFKNTKEKRKLKPLKSATTPYEYVHIKKHSLIIIFSSALLSGFCISYTLIFLSLQYIWFQ